MLAAQPGQLALGELARGSDAALDERIHVELAVQVFPRLPIADRAHRRMAGAEAGPRAQPSHFVHEAALEHVAETLRDTLVQHGAVAGPHHELQHAVRQALRPRALLCRQRPAGERDHFERALDALQREREQLRQLMAEHGAAAHSLEAWDWRYWAEKVRQRHYALDDAQVKPYFALPRVVQAAFDCAQRLFGLHFTPRDDLPVYHPDVKAYEVRDAAGRVVAIFLQDNFARTSKRSGAWMSTLRSQSRNEPGGGSALPVVLNNNNFAKGAPGAPTLLSLEDARTLFHEFGHGLHAMLSDVTFERLSGTQVLKDFVELPSQLFEHWGQDPAVLRRHARHWQTGEIESRELYDHTSDQLELENVIGHPPDRIALEEAEKLLHAQFPLKK